MSYTRKAFRGTALIFSSMAIGVMLSYLIKIILARNLSLSELGMFAGIYTIISILSMFRTLGLDASLLKFIPEFQKSRRYDSMRTLIFIVAKYQAILSIIISSILIASSGLLAEYYFKDPLARGIILILGVSYFVMVWDDLLKRIYQGLQNMLFYAIFEIGRNFFVMAFLVMFLLSGLTVQEVAISYVFSSLLLFMIIFPIFLSSYDLFSKTGKKGLHIRFKEFFIYLREYIYLTEDKEKKRVSGLAFKFGFPVLIYFLGEQIIYHFDILMLTYFSTLEQVGIYSIALPTSMLILYIGRSLSNMLLPMTSEIWARGHKDKLSDGIRRLYNFVFAMAIPIVFGLAFYSEIFLNLFFGEEFISGSLPLRILLFATLFYLIAIINNSIIIGIGFSGLAAKIVIFSAIVNIIANLALIPYLGMIGAAIGTGISYLFATALSIIYLSKRLEIRYDALKKILIVADGILFLIIVSFISGLMTISGFAEIIISCGVAGLAYLAVLFGLKIIDINEIRRIVTA